MHLGGLGRRGVDTGADRPHRLVGEHAAGHGGRLETGQPGPELALDGREREALPALLGRLAHAEHRRQAVPERGGDLAVDLLVGLAHLVPALGVPAEHEATAQLEQHGGRDLAGVGAGRLVVAVLGAERDRAAGHDLADGRQRGERRAQHDLHASRALEPDADGRGERAGLRQQAVHLPVADHERRAHQASVSASTPGSLRPSRNSRKAPPAVEM